MISTILKFLSSPTLRTINKICSTVNVIFKFLSKKHDYKVEKEKKEEMKKDFETIDDVCNNGTMDDLFNLDDKIVKSLIFICIFILTGCINTTPNIHTTKNWENHYMNVEDFHNKTKDIKLEKGESIWVLSNSSLSRLLKDLRKK
jgi:hypothetical protein